MKKLYWLIGTILILSLTGCSNKNNHVIDIYTLKYNKSSDQNHTTPFINKTLKVTTPKSTKEIKKNKILYSKTAHQREAYAYSRWSDTPNHMIEQYLVTLLNQNGLFKAVIPATSEAKADLILESNIEDFYQYFNKDNNSFGVVKIRFFLIDEKSKKILSKRYFNIKNQALSPDAKGGVKALDDALGQIGLQLINWISK